LMYVLYRNVMGLWPRRAIKLTAAFAAALVGIAAVWIWRASLTQQRPNGWPADSIWVQEPGVHFSFAPRGVWEGCWLDSNTGLDRCQFGDYKGRILFRSDYLICEEHRGVPNEELSLKPSTSAFIFLRNGAMLIESNLCKARGGAQNPLLR
jgi:hypothetical protein